MDLEVLINEAKGTKKKEPWELPLAEYILANKKQGVVYQGWASPGFTAPDGVVVLTGPERDRLYGREEVVASHKTYQRDMGDKTFEAWAVKLKSSKDQRFRILLITYLFKEGETFDPRKVVNIKSGNYAVRAGFAFDDMKKPFAGLKVDTSSLKQWGGEEFFDFVKRYGGWNPPKIDEKKDADQRGESILLARRHRQAVAQALRSGKTVSSVVMKDYPRLMEHKPGTPGFYAAQFLLKPIAFAKSGDTVKRVVYGNISSKITPQKPGVLRIPEDPEIHGLHVTHDVNFWKRRLQQDLDRPESKAQVIRIRVVPGDIFLPDHNSQDKSDQASSAILLTNRKILKQGEDFDVEGKLAGKK